MRLTAFKSDSTAPRIRAAPAAREWMDDTPDRFAYRCLPLTIANTHGWEILCPASIEIYWNGGVGLSDLAVRPLEGSPEAATDFAVSHFGSGIVTFHAGSVSDRARLQPACIGTSEPSEGWRNGTDRNCRGRLARAAVHDELDLQTRIGCGGALPLVRTWSSSS